MVGCVKVWRQTTLVLFLLFVVLRSYVVSASIIENNVYSNIEKPKTNERLSTSELLWSRIKRRIESGETVQFKWSEVDEDKNFEKNNAVHAVNGANWVKRRQTRQAYQGLYPHLPTPQPSVYPGNPGNSAYPGYYSNIHNFTTNSSLAPWQQHPGTGSVSSFGNRPLNSTYPYSAQHRPSINSYNNPGNPYYNGSQNSAYPGNYYQGQTPRAYPAKGQYNNTIVNGNPHSYPGYPARPQGPPHSQYGSPNPHNQYPHNFNNHSSLNPYPSQRPYSQNPQTTYNYSGALPPSHFSPPGTFNHSVHPPNPPYGNRTGNYPPPHNSYPGSSQFNHGQPQYPNSNQFGQQNGQYTNFVSHQGNTSNYPLPGSFGQSNAQYTTPSHNIGLNNTGSYYPNNPGFPQHGQYPMPNDPNQFIAGNPYPSSTASSYNPAWSPRPNNTQYSQPNNQYNPGNSPYNPINYNYHNGNQFNGQYPYNPSQQQQPGGNPGYPNNQNAPHGLNDQGHFYYPQNGNNLTNNYDPRKVPPGQFSY